MTLIKVEVADLISGEGEQASGTVGTYCPMRTG